MPLEIEFPNTEDLGYIYPVGTVVLTDQDLEGTVTQLFPGPYPYFVEVPDGPALRLAKSEVVAIKYPLDSYEEIERFLAS